MQTLPQNNGFKLPAAFEEFTEARREGFIKMKNLKESGKKVVGVFCTYTPLEIIYAAGLIPVSLCSSSNEAIKHSEADLPKNLCPLIKASYGVAVSDTCPYFYFADLIVGETTCDGKKKMYELMGKIKDTYVLHLPQNYIEGSSFTLWLNELNKFKNALEKKFNVTITDEDLRAAIRKGNEERINLKNFFELGKLIPAPLTGADMSAIYEGFGFSFDREKKNSDLKAKTQEIYERWEKELKGTKSKRPRILITGCPVLGVREKILKTIEKSGGDIVVYENCSGVREKMELIDESIEPMEAIAEKYLNISCSVMTPNPKRFEDLNTLIDEYKIDGVIEIVLQACHTFAIESTSVNKFVTEKKGKSYMYIESDYSMNDIGQVSTRVEAFLEML
ncbi:double-cubane-cluster-containing anaerobic reductase [Treponema pedis]|uniref:(R)-2-hydroxyglutaryl-CoA dehydratase subunit beta n=1 Tax=Treponema pedis str. T A4 TaxID=1291379 RepID=S5ZTG6_9SPIR|nr:double-cubane-cluster-containing anaerobic reductase [Treponema pedis]AGT43435.1 (R)-2-hydroxyglutaryl-CoA dehydratase subunit beta [Treponema pedis str. T A4]